jgi:nitronate monooxygenase
MPTWPALNPRLVALDLRVPLLQAPMAGGSCTPQLVAAVCEAGALGSLAGLMLSPDDIAAQAAEVRRRTARPFGINLGIVRAPSAADLADLQPIQAALQPWYDRFGLAPSQPVRWCPDFDAQFEALVAARPALASFTFGVLDAAQVGRLHAAGCAVMGTATTPAEARAWARVGADAVCAQGVEAGGHRGTFLHPFDAALLGTVALVPQVVAAVDLPVVAAGGLMDGRAIAAVRTLGAWAAQLGTAFLFCPEARLPPAYLAALQRAAAHDTRLTRAFSGKPARGVVNPMMADLDARAAGGLELPPYPVLNALTAPIRAAAARTGDADALSLWAGQGVSAGRVMPAADLVAALAAEWRAACGA